MSNKFNGQPGQQQAQIHSQVYGTAIPTEESDEEFTYQSPARPYHHPAKPGRNLLPIHRSGLQLALTGLERIAGKLATQISIVTDALKGEGDELTIAAEDLATARQGIEMMVNEAQGQLADVTATLEPVAHGLHRLQRKTLNKIRAGEIVVGYHYDRSSGKPIKTWDNDPERKYRHYKNGEIIVTMGGHPVPASKPRQVSPRLVAEQRERAANARAARTARTRVIEFKRTPEGRYICDKCPNTFISDTLVKRHRRGVHGIYLGKGRH